MVHRRTLTPKQPTRKKKKKKKKEKSKKNEKTIEGNVFVDPPTTTGMSKSYIPEGYQVVSVAPKRSAAEVVATSAKRAKSYGDDDAPVMPAAFPKPDGSPTCIPTSLCGSDEEDDAFVSLPLTVGKKFQSMPQVDAPPELETDEPVPMVRTYSQSLITVTDVTDAPVEAKAMSEEVRAILAQISAEHKTVKAETLAKGRSVEEHLLAIQALSEPTPAVKAETPAKLPLAPADQAFEQYVGVVMRGIAASHAESLGPATTLQEHLQRIKDLVVGHLEQYVLTLENNLRTEDGPAGGPAKKAKTDDK